MRALYLVLFGYSVLISSGFIVAVGNPRRHTDRVLAWVLVVTGWTGLAIDAIFFASLLRPAISPLWFVWSFASAQVAKDAVFTWWLWLALRPRLRRRRQR